MRDIRFRVWDKADKMMHKNIFGISFYDKIVYSAIDGNTNMIFPIKDYELMQFTGLLDKNGKEIYEGDIAKITERRHDGFDYTEIGVMEFNEKEAFFGFKCEKSLLG